MLQVGILIAGLVNYGSNYIHPWGWRLPLALAGTFQQIGQAQFVICRLACE